MAERKRFKVLRPHEGDRSYAEGDIREGTMADLGHLVPKVLEPLDAPAAKAEAAPQNKAEPPPQNKAEAAAPVVKDEPKRDARR